MRGCLPTKTERSPKDILSKVLEITKSTNDVLLKFKVREPSQPVIVISDNTTIYAMPMYRPEDAG